MWQLKLTAMLSNCWNCFLNFPGSPWNTHTHTHTPTDTHTHTQSVTENLLFILVYFPLTCCCCCCCWLQVRTLPPRWVAVGRWRDCPAPERRRGTTTSPDAAYTWNTHRKQLFRRSGSFCCHGYCSVHYISSPRDDLHSLLINVFRSVSFEDVTWTHRAAILMNLRSSWILFGSDWHCRISVATQCCTSLQRCSTSSRLRGRQRDCSPWNT